jgi:hypothetical protein
MNIHWLRYGLAGLIIGSVPVFGLAGCSSSDSSSSKTTPASIIGKACSADSACTALSGGYCPDAGVCTRECAMHSDCGCAANTTNADIGSGKCADACIGVSDTVSVCMKVCSSSSQCQGNTTCEALTSYSVCA